MKLKNKFAVIIGGTIGIGRAISKRLGEEIPIFYEVSFVGKDWYVKNQEGKGWGSLVLTTYPEGQKHKIRKNKLGEKIHILDCSDELGAQFWKKAREFYNNNSNDEKDELRKQLMKK